MPTETDHRRKSDVPAPGRPKVPSLPSTEQRTYGVHR